MLANVHIAPAFHFFFSFFFIIVLLPWMFFKPAFHEETENIVSNVIKMTCLMIALGYALVMLHLFELLSVAFLLFVIGFRFYTLRRGLGKTEEALTGAEALLYDYFDGKYKLTQVFVLFVRERYEAVKNAVSKRLRPYSRLLGTLCLLTVVLPAVYILFADALLTAAPPFGDGYGSLQGVKEIRQNQLFSGGIHPRGLHVFLAVLQEFARIDGVYILKYAGPLFSLLTLLGIYFVLSRLTGNRSAGIVGMFPFVFAAGAVYESFWERQVGLYAVEFAYLFYLPTLYFFYLYFTESNRNAYWTMTAGLCVIALVHPLPFLYAAAGAGVFGFILYLAKRKKRTVSVFDVVRSVAAAGALSVAPLAVGLLLGKGEFSLARIGFERDVVFHAAASFGILLASAAAGGAWQLFFQFFSRLSYKKALENGGLALLIVALLFLLPPRPEEPLKVDWDAAVEQYIRITREFKPNTWLIVSKEEWIPIIEGRGYHMHIGELVRSYDPTQAFLTKYGEDEPDMNVPPHVFLYYEKRLRRAAGEAMRVNWEQNGADLREWLTRYRAAHPEVVPYFENEHLVIYHLQRREEQPTDE